MTERFQGFSPEGLAVLAGLEQDNSKAFFEAHRAVYDAGVVAPAKRFVVELADALSARVSPGVVAEPKVDGSLFRLHRDTRFGKDKSPYKTLQALFVGEGPSKKVSSGVYLALHPARVNLGVGSMMLPDLSRWREGLVGHGDAFRAALAEAERSSAGLGTSEPVLKRVPKGYDPDHPLERFLRMKHFHASVTLPAPKTIARRGFLDWCLRRFEPMGALHRWLVAHA